MLICTSAQSRLLGFMHLSSFHWLLSWCFYLLFLHQSTYCIRLHEDFSFDACDIWFLHLFTKLYWDLVIDWGLLQRYSVNPWLRDQLILKKKYLYFISMAVNTVLRVAWLSSIQRFNFIPGLSRPGWEGIFAILEVIRRGHWNFYRAVKSVPLPFDEFGHGAFL